MIKAPVSFDDDVLVRVDEWAKARGMGERGRSKAINALLLMALDGGATVAPASECDDRTEQAIRDVMRDDKCTRAAAMRTIVEEWDGRITDEADITEALEAEEGTLETCEPAKRAKLAAARVALGMAERGARHLGVGEGAMAAAGVPFGETRGPMQKGRPSGKQPRPGSAGGGSR